MAQGTDVNERQIQLIIVDDHPLVRNGLSEILKQYENIAVIGTTDTFQGLLEIYDNNQTAVILMDVNMPGMNGIEMTHALLEQFPAALILMLTSHEEEDIVVEALDAGARGIIMKDTEISELVRAIITTFQGQRFLAPQALEVLIHHKTSVPYPHEQLTPRELQVLHLLAQG